MSDSERGAAPIELALAIGFLLIPMAVLVLSIAPWLERQSMARVAAGEAARVLVLSEGTEPDVLAALSTVKQIAENHGIDPEGVRVFFCADQELGLADKLASTCPDLARGGLITVEVQVLVPAAEVLGIGTFGEGTVSAQVTEQVELYRGFSR